MTLRASAVQVQLARRMRGLDGQRRTHHQSVIGAQDKSALLKNCRSRTARDMPPGLLLGTEEPARQDWLTADYAAGGDYELPCESGVTEELYVITVFAYVVS
jgi:hypothetical protein